MIKMLSDFFQLQSKYSEEFRWFKTNALICSQKKSNFFFKWWLSIVLVKQNESINTNKTEQNKQEKKRNNYHDWIDVNLRMALWSNLEEFWWNISFHLDAQSRIPNFAHRFRLETIRNDLEFQSECSQYSITNYAMRTTIYFNYILF